MSKLSITYIFSFFILIASLDDDSKTIVTLKDVTFTDGICYAVSEFNSVYFTINFDYEYYNELNSDFEIGVIVTLSSNENSFDSICKGWIYHDKKNSYLNCVSEFGIFIDGFYHVELGKEIENDNYIIKKFSDDKTILNVNDYYVEPVDKIKNVYHNYADSEIGKINIQFRKKLYIDGLPKVYIKENQKELKCENNENNLICEFDNELLPVNPENPTENYTYDLYLVNYCGVKEVDITVQVKNK